MTKRTFGPPLGPPTLNWADAVVFLSLVGLFASTAWLGHGLWAPFTAEVRPVVDLSPWKLPSYAARSLVRMFAALGASLVFTLVVATWAAKSARAARLILPALDILQSVPVLGFLSVTVAFFIALVLTRPEAAGEEPPSETRVVAPLPHARVGALAGFLEIVAERGGRVDLHRLAAELLLDVHELLPLVDAAALLGWVEVREGDAILSGDGHAFVEAPVLARKQLFGAALERRTTLVTRFRAGLVGKANGRLPESFFLGLLEEHFSRAEARRQLDTAIDWGRYAELFAFEDDTDELFLEPPG